MGNLDLKGLLVNLIGRKMANVLMIIAPHGFRDEELLIPKEILERAGHKVKVASIARGKATGSMGAIVETDFAIYEANSDFFDCVIVVGGPGSPVLAEKQEVLSLVEKANNQKKIVAAICLGPMTLAKAGVLAGKKATTFPDKKAIDMLRDGGALYTTQPVVIDENVVTADGPDSAAKFGETIVKMLNEE